MAHRKNDYVPPVDPTYTPEDIERMTKDINSMDQFSMAHMQRFTKSGHPYFRMDLPFYKIFEARFKELGGMTPEISKELGWGN